ncbi:MAG: hypothetical protein A2144_11505 [Chloroflexi bacterium RBG_16_50_9]|nr:MAG: hypothetical protein A2144_11505 [Chloroflexi bacterium RBG_16_50_9]
MKRSLKYLGFLGFLGLLGLFTGNLAFYGFFNFFGLWGILNRKQKSDELLISNAAKAGRNAFIVSLVAVSLTIAALSVIKTLQAAQLSIAVVFMAQLLTFIFSFNYYEKRGNV